MRLPSLLICSFMLIAIAGCGATTFTCPAPASGLKCSSVSTVYDKALSGELQASVEKPQDKTRDNKTEPPETTQRPQVPPTVVGRLVADKMVPLRIPPKIIRIWFAPWEDDDGDLIQGGFVYSEISDPKNRWVIGEKKTTGSKNNMRFFSGKAPSKLPEGTMDRKSLAREQTTDNPPALSQKAQGSAKQTPPPHVYSVKPSAGSNVSTGSCPGGVCALVKKESASESAERGK